MQEELLDVSTGSRLPLVKPPRPFRPSERAVAPPRDLAAPRAVAAPLESVEMETLEPVALLLDGGRPALFFAPPGPENKLRVALAAGDQVRVTVFGEDDLSGEFEIDAGGHLILPLIGRVAAAGASADQLGALIVTTLRQDGYMKQPRVSVEILNLRPIFVMGEVNNPGSYPYSTGLTALKAIALAGGFTYRAKKKVLFVTRDPEQGEQKLRVDNLVRPGDTIRVKERWF